MGQRTALYRKHRRRPTLFGRIFRFRGRDALWRIQGFASGLGEGNYTISVWAKPTTLSPPVDYDFATAWYEGGGGDWMQVRTGQGMVTLANYNSLSILDPGDPQQSPLFPQGVTERIFDGSFGNAQLDPIDSGSGFLTRSDHVYEDTAFDLPINFNAGAVDARSGGLTERIPWVEYGSVSSESEIRGLSSRAPSLSVPGVTMEVSFGWIWTAMAYFQRMEPKAAS